MDSVGPATILYIVGMIIFITIFIPALAGIVVVLLAYICNRRLFGRKVYWLYLLLVWLVLFFVFRYAILARISARSARNHPDVKLDQIPTKILKTAPTIQEGVN